MLPGLQGFDALFVRTVTRLNKNTVPVIPESLRFIASASAGTDHIDTDYFEANGVKVINAAGCNARAVAEYVMTALLLWKEKRGKTLTDYRFGVIGAGATGTEVLNLFKIFGLETVSYDPPRALRDPDYISASLEEVLRCDILTFHVPYREDGEFPTRYLLNTDILAKHRYDVVINASRGGVVDENAVLRALQQGTIGDIIIDVWENEPDFNPHTSAAAFIATPHIAGYSEQAKYRATRLIVDGLYDFLGITPGYSHKAEESRVFGDKEFKNLSLSEILMLINPLMHYDRALRRLADKPGRGKLFRALREKETYRFEYPELAVPRQVLLHNDALQKLGVKST